MAQAASPGQVAFASILTGAANTLTINAPINLQYSRLVVDGAGDTVINGAISATLPAGLNLATLNSLATGDYAFTSFGQNYTVRVDNDGTNSWLLIGRGRDGWLFDQNGQGNPANVNQNLGVVAGFTPDAFSDILVNNLLAQAGVTNTSVELRVRRATDTAGVQPYQESRFFNFVAPNFTLDFDGGSGIPAAFQVSASSLGSAVPAFNINTRDTDPTSSIPGGPAGFARSFTWPWGGHNNRQGFSYGGAIQGVDGNNPNTFLWEFAAEAHAIPYTELYLRITSQLTQDNSVTKKGAGTLTLTGANSYAGQTAVAGGTLVAANNSALGTSAAGVLVSSGATLGLSGSVTVAGETITLNGVGAAGQPGALVNLSGNNTLAASSSIIALAASAGQIGIGSVNDGGTGYVDTLTINAPINLQYSRLITDGTGDIVINGAISATPTASGAASLANLNLYGSGTQNVVAGSQLIGARRQRRFQFVDARRPWAPRLGIRYGRSRNSRRRDLRSRYTRGLHPGGVQRRHRQ